MLSYNKIEVSEGIDINKTSASKECDICHYWYFLNKGFKLKRSKCHNLLMMSMNLSNIAIFNIKVSDYH